MKDLSTTAKKLDTFFHILYICITILLVSAIVGLVIIGAAFLLKLDPDMVGTGYEMIDAGFLELEIAPEYAPSKQLVLIQAAIQLSMGFLCALCGRICTRHIREILQPMTRNEPFSTIVSLNLKKLAVLSIILGISMNLLQLADHLMLVFALRLPELLISEKILHVGETFTFDISFLAVSALLLLLSDIFRYGEELQQLSDETL